MHGGVISYDVIIASDGHISHSSIHHDCQSQIIVYKLALAILSIGGRKGELEPLQCNILQ